MASCPHTMRRTQGGFTFCCDCGSLRKSPGKWKAQSGPMEVTPIDDSREHEAGEGCWCTPTVQSGVIVHNSLDGRERVETVSVTGCLHCDLGYPMSEDGKEHLWCDITGTKDYSAPCTNQ
jgi:hypothetical protein